MTSRERIHKILNFQTPDRIGIHDTFLNSTIESWKKGGLPSDILPEDYFGFDLKIYDIDEVLSKGLVKNLDSEKFTILSFPEPFQRLCNIYGREDSLRRLARYPESFKADLIHEAERILNSFETIFKMGKRFDGAWAWGDLAYDKGLFFSPSFYKKILFFLHKELFQFLRSRSLFIFFHSDGDISDLIPYLIRAGVRAFHPLEEKSGIDIYRLQREYKRDMVFMGCIDIERLLFAKNYFTKLKRRIDTMKNNSFYIYHADHPIMPNISFKDYSLMIEMVKGYGAYKE